MDSNCRVSISAGTPCDKANAFVCTILKMNNQPLDLNRLRVFRAVWEHRNVSRAAESLGVSQPTVSHALRYLRTHYKDRIFVRCPGG
jgi:DNA-binding transcriptional ArsR family regulator